MNPPVISPAAAGAYRFGLPAGSLPEARDKPADHASPQDTRGRAERHTSPEMRELLDLKPAPAQACSHAVAPAPAALRIVPQPRQRGDTQSAARRATKGMAHVVGESPGHGVEVTCLPSGAVAALREKGQGQGQEDRQDRQSASMAQHAGYEKDSDFDSVHGDAPVRLSTHMARHAARLPDACEAHCQQYGRPAMPAFLRKAMEGMVVDFVRDLAMRLEALYVSGKPPQAIDAGKPVGQACDEFLDLMRRLYAKYAGPSQLYGDARDVLCNAGDALARQVLASGSSNEAFRNLMSQTIHPLLPIFVMACMPSPSAVARGRLAAGAAA